jgi:hypothetical protein
MQLKPIDQQVLAVVGAFTGIGRETALQFAARGAERVVSAWSESGLQSLVAEIEQSGGEAIAVPADVTVLEQVLRSPIKLFSSSGNSIPGYTAPLSVSTRHWSKKLRCSPPKQPLKASNLSL